MSWKSSNSSASCKKQSLQVGTSAAEAASARKPLPKSPSLHSFYVKTSCSLQAPFQSLEVGAGLTGTRWQCQWYSAGILALLFCLRPALLIMGRLDFKNNGHTQLVPVAGQGNLALQLLALVPEGISYFPPKVLSGQPLFLQLNRIFCLIDVTEYSETVMFTTTVAVFHCILHLSAAQKHSSHPLNESYPSTVFLGRHCVISFPK